GLWMVRLIWTRPSSRPARSFPEADTTVSLLGYRFVRNGLGIPILLFLALVSFQLVPLPPGLVRLISPAAAASFSRGLPGYDRGAVDFTKIESWLLGDDAPAAGVVEPLLKTSGDPLLPARLTYGAARPISLYPFATIGRLLMLSALLLGF